MKILAGIFAVILVGFLFWLGLNWGQTPAPQSQSTPAPTAGGQEASQEESAPTQSAIPSAVSNATAKAVVTQDFSGLKSYLTEPVAFTLYATECCGTLTRDEAIGQLSYLNGGTAPWNFDESNPLAASLLAASPTNFEGSIIGTSKDGYVVAFHVSDAGKIDRIFVSADYKLITQ